jgi:hypothetical protein
VIGMKLKSWFPILLLILPAAPSWGQALSVAITWPTNNEAVGGIIAVTGTATDDAAVSSVGVSLDGGAYSPATGTSIWAFAIYANLLPVGAHTVTARAVGASGEMAFADITIDVFHSDPNCSHSLAGQGVFCEQKASDVESASPTNPSSSASVTFPNGYAAGDTIIVGVSANDRNLPWVAGDISNTAGYTWTFWGNVGSGNLDNNLVQAAVYYTVVPSTTSGPDTIAVTNPGSAFTVEEALVYSGLREMDGAGGNAIGWGGPGVNATTGNYTVTKGDLNIAFAVGAPTSPGPGWTERVEDDSRPYTMFIDQPAGSKTANASWTMNVEGYIAIGIAFKPSSPPAIGVRRTKR